MRVRGDGSVVVSAARVEVDNERTVQLQRLGLCTTRVAQALVIRGQAVLDGVGQYNELINSL